MSGLNLSKNGLPLIKPLKIAHKFQLNQSFLNFDLTHQVQQSGSRIVLPDEFKKVKNRKELIEKFLNNNKDKHSKALSGDASELVNLLDKFAVEVLLHGKYGDLDQLLLETKPTSVKRSISLPVVPSTPKRSKVTFDEIEGDLESETKVIKIGDVPLREMVCYECD